jgi:excisionase family DNA binding protein
MAGIPMTYDVRDICNRFSVNEHTVLRWIHSGELRAINVGVSPGKKKPRWRVTEEALATFEALRTPSPPPPRTRRRRRSADVVEFYK